MNFYIGFAIDQANTPPQDIFNEWTSTIEKVINDHYASRTPINMLFFNPFSAYRGAKGLTRKEDIAYLVKVNDLALMEADYAVFLWQDSPSFGVPYEILQRLQKGGVLVHNVSKKSPGLYLQHHVNLGVNSHLTDGTVTDFCEKLKWMISYNDKQQVNPKKENENE